MKPLEDSLAVDDPGTIPAPEVAEAGANPELLDCTFLATEVEFYSPYKWCLNAFPTTAQVVQYLHRELARLETVPPDWRLDESLLNVFLLSCEVLDAVDDYLAGGSCDFSVATRFIPFAAAIRRAAERALKTGQKVRSLRLRGLREGRRKWKLALDHFLRLFVTHQSDERRTLLQSARALISVAAFPMPKELQRWRCRYPAAFRNQDLTHYDILALREKFTEEYPDRARSILVMGLRTAGSYFAPLLAASLSTNGYRHVDWVTTRPKRGFAPSEHAALTACGSRRGMVIVVDEPANTGGTLGQVFRLLQQVGFRAEDIAVLVPVHPAGREWRTRSESLALVRARIISLEPEEWYKHRYLESETIEQRLREYFAHRGYLRSRVAASERLNSELQALSEEKWHTRLKRVFEVQLDRSDGGIETRCVLAKSVGWGWLSYHALLAARELAEFVPPTLGLRDGVLYTEWVRGAHSVSELPLQQRRALVQWTASYIARRVNSLGLEDDPSPDLARTNRHNGYERLATVLSRAYGSKVAAVLRRPRLRRELSSRPCPCPTFTDARMRAIEWLATSSGFRKADFEHHGTAKMELNMTDPAYDLAEAILHLKLTESEERALIDQYVGECGDHHVERRLFLNKVLAAVWGMTQSLDNLPDPRLLHRREEFHRQYMAARDFLTLQTMRYCAGHCYRSQSLKWQSPLVVLDIDGVIDRQVFGYPCTTAAGMKALSLLHSHSITVALNTARSFSELKQYCEGYRLAGGVAEYGGVLWDAVRRRQLVVVSPESLAELEEVRAALRRIPGIFLDDAYRYSIRGFTYSKNSTAPLPTSLARDLIARLKCHRLRIHETDIDTAVLPKDVDKGVALVRLLEWAGEGSCETIAVGDSNADLPMFRVASRCFAPANVRCRQAAESLGCYIAKAAYQPGLLEIVRSILHPNGSRCDRCEAFCTQTAGCDHLFLDLLKVADETRWSLLLRAALDPQALQVFAR